MSDDSQDPETSPPEDDLQPKPPIFVLRNHPWPYVSSEPTTPDAEEDTPEPEEVSHEPTTPDEEFPYPSREEAAGWADRDPQRREELEEIARQSVEPKAGLPTGPLEWFHILGGVLIVLLTGLLPILGVLALLRLFAS